MLCCVVCSGVGSPPEAEYTEHSLIGYRWYDYNYVTPSYCFGHGLSFTTFTYTGLQTSSLSSPDVGQQVEVDVTNTGALMGSEVVQLYLTSPTSTATNGEAKRQLKRFVKLNNLAPGDTQRVSLSLSTRDLSVWDEATEDWQVVTGTYTVYVGTSSCDFRQSTTFEV